MDKTKEEIEKETHSKYSGETGTYSPEAISVLPDVDPKDFSQKLLSYKFGIIRELSNGCDVLDVGCGNGLHAMQLANVAKWVCGVDFSEAFISYARNYAEDTGVQNVRFDCDNARALPYEDNTFDVAYCFAALYHIPDALEVVSEIARVLRPGGKCVLEFGNRNSLNSIVCEYYPEFAKGCHITVGAMEQIVDEARLNIIDHHSFQFLPMWGDRPHWMKLLMHPKVNQVMSSNVLGRMIDEWVCMLPIIKNFAFRHILVCEKSLTNNCS